MSVTSTPRPALVAALVLLCGAAGCGVGEIGGELDDGKSEFLPASASPIAEAAAPDAAEVTYARELTERRTGVTITDERHAKPRVIYSIRLPRLGRGERLLLRGEVTLSRCNRKDLLGLSGDAAITPCTRSKLRDNPYSYNPRFHAAFFLSEDADRAEGERLSPWRDRKCTESEHHCALALPQVKATPRDADARYLNLVVSADADGANARSFDVMEVEQRKGGLHVTRLGPDAPAPVVHAESDQLRASGLLRVDQPAEDGGNPVRHELYRIKLTGLKPGDVLDADARARVVVRMTSGCDPLVTGELILTERADARELKGDHDRRLTAKNGQNAADHSARGTGYRKSGAVQIPKGASSTMYLKYIAMAARSCARPGRDRWKVEPGDGSLEATLRRSGRRAAKTSAPEIADIR